jgi:hypothetical protein
MDNDTKNELLRFALRNSNLSNPAIEPTDIKNEIARNANKLSLSKITAESSSGKKLLKMTSNDGNKTSEALLESKSDFARSNRDKRTQKEGFSSITALLIAEWQSGRYKSKVDCAKNNYEKLGMSYDKAIDDLKNIPKTGLY